MIALKQQNCFTLLVSSGNDIPKNSLSQLTSNTVSLYFRLPYTPPYEQYNGLRKLLLQIRKKSNSEIPETLVIDLTEWLEHDKDEFFDITVKFLYDHKDIYNYIFVIRNCDQRKYNALFVKIRTFMPGNITKDLTFTDEQHLEKYISCSCKIDSKALKLLSAIIMHDSADQLRSYTVIDNLTDELEHTSGNGMISVLSIKKALSDPNTLLGAMLGNDYTLTKIISSTRKDIKHEKEAV